MVTADFYRDRKISLVKCNPKVSGGRAYRRKGVWLGETNCAWKWTWKEEVQDDVGFRTVFRMFRTEKEYFLQIIGESERSDVFSDRYKVIVFKSPKELSEILQDSEDRRVYMSEPVVELIEKIAESRYLDEKEQQEWVENCLYI